MRIHFPTAAHLSDSDGGDNIYADQASRDRALRYTRLHQWLMLVGLLFNAGLSALALISGFSARIRSWAAAAAPARVGPVMPYALVISLLSFVTSLPLSYIGGFTIEHRFELSNQSRLGWIRDELKGLAVSLVFTAPLLQGVMWIIRRYPRRWWLVLSGLTVPFTVLLVNLIPVLIMPIFNRFEPLRDTALAERVKELARSEGVQVSSVMQMDMSKQTKKANAFFTGIGRTKRIVLGDTLLDEFTPDEVEVVIAHELGHQVHRDLWKGIALGAGTTTLIAYAVNHLMGPLIRRWGSNFGLNVDEGPADVAALPLLGLVAGAVSLVLLPLQNAVSRNFMEHPADQYALDLTSKNAAFVSAMEKLGRMNLSNPKPSRLIKWLLYSHPPLNERVEFGKQYRPRAR